MMLSALCCRLHLHQGRPQQKLLSALLLSENTQPRRAIHGAEKGDHRTHPAVADGGESSREEPAGNAEGNRQLQLTDRLNATIRRLFGRTKATQPPVAQVQLRDAINIAKMSEQDRYRLRQRLNLRFHKRTKDANRVVYVALTMNVADVGVKAGAYLFTGSNAIFAEAVHSCMDMLNQISLLWGNYYAMKKPSPNFPYGFGNMRYVSSLIAGCAIFGFGGGLSVYNGAHGLFQAFIGASTELQSLPLACSMLLVSASLQAVSLSRAVFEIRKQADKRQLEFFAYLNSDQMDPSLKVVFYEDRASLYGVLIALSAVSASHFTGIHALDSLGSICIGLLLANAAWHIIRTNTMLLGHRSLPDEEISAIVALMEQDPIVRKVSDVKATYIGVSDERFKAEIEYNGREITRAYLHEQCDLDQMLEEVQSINDKDKLEEFMLKHGDKVVDLIGDKVDLLEQRIQERHPNVRHMDLEPM